MAFVLWTLTLGNILNSPRFCHRPKIRQYICVRIKCATPSYLKNKSKSNCLQGVRVCEQNHECCSQNYFSLWSGFRESPSPAPEAIFSRRESAIGDRTAGAKASPNFKIQNNHSVLLQKKPRSKCIQKSYQITRTIQFPPGLTVYKHLSAVS